MSHNIKDITLEKTGNKLYTKYTMINKQKFYAYLIPKDNKSGITNTWKECEAKVKNVDNARFKSFSTREGAEQWVNQGAHYSQKETFTPGIYFDAGTGRGNGVETSVTNEKWESLLLHFRPTLKINAYGKHLLGNYVTNNYGELFACFCALQIALKLKVKEVYGDSALIINYWSKGFIKKDELPLETVKLSQKVTLLRKDFESRGGTITLISGGANPADLGFH